MTATTTSASHDSPKAMNFSSCSDPGSASSLEKEITLRKTKTTEGEQGANSKFEASRTPLVAAQATEQDV